jgi:hypothetical protein
MARVDKPKPTITNCEAVASPNFIDRATLLREIAAQQSRWPLKRRS